MPTPKQTRALYKRVRFHWWQLHKALNDAHNAEVIKYDSSKYGELAPCFSMGELKERIENTTLKARAEALKQEVMDEMKDVW